MGETSKAHDRRVREGWFERYVRAPGIDLGAGIDPLLAPGFISYDREWMTRPKPGGYHVVRAVSNDIDAQRMPGVADESFLTVYSSHLLEHLDDPGEGLRNWWRILKPGGHLIVCVPHRDLYEKKKTKPSRWNSHLRPGGGGHQTFWLPDRDDPPDTLSLRRLISETLPDAKMVEFKVLDEGYDYTLPEDVHPVGEFGIEAILLKE